MSLPSKIDFKFLHSERSRDDDVVSSMVFVFEESSSGKRHRYSQDVVEELARDKYKADYRHEACQRVLAGRQPLS